jgi:hypothetical protein
VRGIQEKHLAECEAMLIEAAASAELAGTPMVRMLPSTRGHRQSIPDRHFPSDVT